MLYTVRFTTQKRIKKLDARGNVVSEERLDTPVCLTALPHATAMSYSKCDNFEIEVDVQERRGSSRINGVGNGTKKVWNADRATPPVASKKSKSSASAMTATQRAAATGDMTAAISN